MKKMILAFTTLAIAGASVQTASAGGCGWGYGGRCGWSTAGQVLAGVTVGLVIGEALAPRPAYYVAPGYGYAYSYASAAPPAVVYSAPARVVYAARPPVVYAAPAPVVVYRPPVYVAPPIVSFSVGYYGGGRAYCYRGGRW